MRLFIAEKPSLARAIAQGLGNGKKENGCIVCGDDTVTWCFGHILEQYDPDEYDEKYKHWNLEDLPIIPDVWKLNVKKDAAAQFKIIKGLIGKAEIIVNAGDPDREGQLLVDEVLEYVHNKKPVQRILLNALDDKSVKEALNDLRNNEDFLGLKNSALARSRADWLVGMNLTRAFTIRGRQAGYDGVVSVGRVQTPTMALVVRREEEIKNFKSTTHYEAKVIFQHANGILPTTWKFDKELDGVDEEGRLLDKSIAESVIEKVKSAGTGTIESVEQKKKQEGQRLPYSLSALQIEAGRRYGYTPQQVLDTMQSLYEKKYTTYPRSDCDYLPENQYAEAGHVISNLNAIEKDGLNLIAAKADTSIHSRAWNDKKISAHHAIVPTGEKVNFDSLDQREQNLYVMVAMAYLAQFYPIHTYLATRITVKSADETFIGNGKQIIDNGWKAIYQKSAQKDEEGEEDDSSVVLPEVHDGESVTYMDAKLLEKQTKPPKRFTPSTLLKAMKEIYRYVKDGNLKSELKECSGIGTEATRAGIIDKLQKAAFLGLDKSKKYLIPLEKAYMAVKVLPDEITYPDTTAVWEKELDEVSKGSMDLSKFTQSQTDKLNLFLKAAETVKIVPPKNVPTCPKCGKVLKRIKSKKNGKYYWICSDRECKTIFGDKNGKPDLNPKKKTSSLSGLTATCPKCGKKLRQIKGKFGVFWGCEDRSCNASFNDHKDKPVIEKCPGCGKGYLRRYESKKKPGNFFWACTEHCGKFYRDNDGLPNLEA